MLDNDGASVTVRFHVARPISSYTVDLANESTVGRANFVDSPDGDRIFFHTEIDEEFGGRGLAGLLVREALADSMRKRLTVVPVCPLFARHLRSTAMNSSPTAVRSAGRHPPISHWSKAQ